MVVAFQASHPAMAMSRSRGATDASGEDLIETGKLFPPSPLPAIFPLVTLA
jgi:hypothetical protein